LRSSKADGVEIVRSLMSIFHLYVLTSGADRHPRKMSPEFGADLLGQVLAHRLGAKAPGPDTIRNKWNEHRQSAALIYAASYTRIGKKTLLYHLCFSPPVYKVARTVRWMRMAGEITEIVLGSCKFRKEHKSQFVAFPKLKSVKIPPPDLWLCEVAWLVEEFQETPKERNEIINRIERESGKKCAARDRVEAGRLGGERIVCSACKKFSGHWDNDLNPRYSR